MATRTRVDGGGGGGGVMSMNKGAISPKEQTIINFSKLNAC